MIPRVCWMPAQGGLVNTRSSQRRLLHQLSMMCTFSVGIVAMALNQSVRIAVDDQTFWTQLKMAVKRFFYGQWVAIFAACSALLQNLTNRVVRPDWTQCRPANPIIHVRSSWFRPPWPRRSRQDGSQSSITAPASC